MGVPTFPNEEFNSLTKIYDTKKSKEEVFKIEKLDNKRPILVVFLGGCTYSEVSCIRLLSQIKNQPYIVLTTNFTNGDLIMKEFLEFIF